MEISFTKMNGAGNDFVVLDNRDHRYDLSKDQIAQLCDRHRGVGADGLLAVEPAENGADVKFRYYNADGGEAEMCGNGARCFGAYVNRLTQGKGEPISFETIAGTLEARFHGDEVEIAMSDPFDWSMNNLLSAGGGEVTVHSVNTGVPHAVVQVDNLAETNIIELGSDLRYHGHFAPAGTNANAYQATGDRSISIRTYERGVEAETLACGTGMVACSLVHDQLNQCGSPVAVKVKGGDTLSIGFRQASPGSYPDITLTGPADFVFEGNLSL